jgi:DNA-directed RNA polymerase subunit RPC12/RpoP
LAWRGVAWRGVATGEWDLQAEGGSEGDASGRPMADDEEYIANLEDRKGASLREWVLTELPRREIQRRFKNFLSSFVDEHGDNIHAGKIKAMCEVNGESLVISYTHLCQEHPVLAIFVADAPTEVLEIFDNAAKEVVLSSFPAYDKIRKEIHVRIAGLPVSDHIRDIRQSHLNQLVKVTGVVNRRSGIFPQLKLVSSGFGTHDARGLDSTPAVGWCALNPGAVAFQWLLLWWCSNGCSSGGVSMVAPLVLFQWLLLCWCSNGCSSAGAPLVVLLCWVSSSAGAPLVVLQWWCNSVLEWSDAVHLPASNLRHTCVTPAPQAVYECVKCEATIGPFVQDSVEPSAISNCPECQSKGPFSLKHDQTIYQNYQKVTIQESPGSVPAGRLPRAKDVILLADLVDSIKPGDEISLTGIYRNNFDQMLNARQGFPVFKTAIEANYIERAVDKVSRGAMTDEEIAQIRELSTQENIAERIFASMAPSIHGHEDIKIALALSLFGGEAKVLENKMRVRGDINVLILGDPGTGKSQFLKYVSQVSPRAVFTTGQGASAVGLTVGIRGLERCRAVHFDVCPRSRSVCVRAYA